MLQAAGAGLYQAVNPTEDTQLPYAATEAAAIGELVADRLVQYGRKATKGAVAAGAADRAYHLSDGTVL